MEDQTSAQECKQRTVVSSSESEFLLNDHLQSDNIQSSKSKLLDQNSNLKCCTNCSVKIQGGARNVIPLIVHVTHFYYCKNS